MLKNYNIEDDYYLETYFEDNDLTDDTQKNYVKNLTKFCKAVDKRLCDIIEDCKAQQNIETEEILSTTNEDGNTVIQKRVIKFEVDGADSLIRQHFKRFEKYCKERGNKNTTINTGLDAIRAVLSHFKVELPNYPNLKDDSYNWELLTKDDFKFILADSSLMHKSLTLFMLSTGMRISDCLNLTIGEYMKNTSDYHNFVEVDDFIDNAPDDMIGYFDFMPQKTKGKETLCRTFNSPESNKFILQNLRRVKNEYLPKKFKNDPEKRKLKKTDALFGSKRGFYKKAPERFSISSMFGRKNKKLYEWHINRIKQDIKNGKISVEDYDRQVDLIPKFHPHACRKYFCSVIAKHTSNERQYRLLEGHAPANKIDKSYIDIQKDSLLEVYNEALVDLSVYVEANEDINKLREDFEEKELYYKQVIEGLKAELEKTNKTVRALDRKIDQSRTNIPFHNVRDVIMDYLSAIGEVDSDRVVLLELMVYDYARNNPKDFKDDSDYLYSLVRRFDIEIELSNKDVFQQTVEIAQTVNYENIDPALISFIDDLAKIIKANDGVMRRIGYLDMDKFDYIAEEYLVNSGIVADISNVDLSYLSQDDKHRIAVEVLKKYVDS